MPRVFAESQERKASVYKMTESLKLYRCDNVCSCIENFAQRRTYPLLVTVTFLVVSGLKFLLPFL